MAGRSGTIPNNIVDEVRERVDLVSLINEYVPLKKAGQNFIGRCPFHDEKTPSFSVSPTKGMFYCFGCSTGGNAYTFLMKHEGMTFVDAVRFLAARVGVEIPKPSETRSKAYDDTEKKMEQLRDALDFALEEFQRNLLNSRTGEIAMKYLTGRSVSEDTIKEFRIGYALDDWEGMVGALKRKGLSLKPAVEAGLITPRGNETGYYDRFRNRIIFPIFNVSGKPIAFAGRILKDEKDQAKYINSPETPLYQKSRVLYGLDLAKNHIRKMDSAILVEGYFDQISLYLGGIRNTVATCGTALTNEHVNILKRYSKNIYTLFDSDESGIRASMRSLPIILNSGAVQRMVAIDDGDPDSYIKKFGPDAMKSLISGARPMMEVFVDQEIEKAGPSPEARSEAAKNVARMIANMSDRVLKDIYCRDFAQKIGISEDLFRSMTREHSQKLRREPRAERGETPVKNDKPSAASPEATIVQTIFHFPELRERVLEARVIDEFKSEFLKTLTNFIIASKEDDEKTDVAAFLKNGDFGERQQTFVAKLSVETEPFADKKQASKALEDCIQAVLKRRKEAEREKVQIELKRSVEKGDEEQELEMLERIVAMRANKV